MTNADPSTHAPKKILSTVERMDRQAFLATDGYGALLIALVLLGGAGLALFRLLASQRYGFDGMALLLMVLAFVAAAFIFKGVYSLPQNESAVFTLFGSYAGTDQNAGLRFTNPFYTVTKISRRIQNFQCDTLKVNDLAGNPIEIAAVVVWRVKDAARALLQVQDYEDFVNVQTESALRKIAGNHPYDSHEESKDAKGSDAKAEADKPSVASLLEDGDQVTGELVAELHKRFAEAGVEVDEARITHLAYAPEIAGVMLRRQQAAAVIAARSKVVEGAVSIVKEALKQLSSGEGEDKITLDPERRAAMVSNLLVVLVSDKDATPVVNAGTLYAA